MNVLISLTKDQVPLYLVGSDFYNSLSSDDGDDFQIPEMYFKPTPSLVNIPSDLSHLLNTLKFWGLQVFPRELIVFLLKKAPSVDIFDQVCTVLAEFDADYNLLKMYKAISVCERKHSAQLEAVALCRRTDILEYFVGFNKKASISMVKQAAEHGLLELLKDTATALRAKDKGNPFSQVSLKKVAGNGHVDCLHYLLEQGCVPDRSISLAAAENGHLGYLQVAHQHKCWWDSKTLNAAALHGHLPCLTYLLEHGCPLDRTSAYNAALNGHLECLRLLIDHEAPLTKRMCNAAATNGHLSCLQLLFERGCAWDKECARLAVTHDHFECLRFAVENGCRCDCSVADAAAGGGHTQCLEYLLSAHKPASSFAVEHAARNGHLDCVKTLFQAGVAISSESHAMWSFIHTESVVHLQTLVAGGYKLPHFVTQEALERGSYQCLGFICSVKHHPLTADDAACAARCGYLQGLKILHEHGCPWDGRVYKAAAARGHVEVLRYAIEHGCPRGTDDLCATAAGSGNLEVLEYLHSQGFPLTLQTCRSSIRINSLKCLGFAVEHGAPLDATLCVDAIKDIKFSPDRAMEFLRYLREAAHCPWDEITAAAAAGCGLTFLEYVHEHGCPWDAATPMAALEAGNTICLHYAIRHDCPCPENICTEVALLGVLESLILLHERGYHWDATTTAAAAESGDLDILEYLYENGCPWDERTPAMAAQNGYLFVLEFAHENGCVWDISTTLAAAEAGNLDCLEYAHENGCPWDETVSEAAIVGNGFEENECFEYCYENNCRVLTSTLREYNRHQRHMHRENPCCVM